ncbi:hypothetical protein LE191_11925 [Janthinobacterium sp. HSC-3S05]|nr:hypothetical protein [Janthinobacterium lividum]MCA1860809.1 hypothetical protein [Janthinobacterium lividum]
MGTILESVLGQGIGIAEAASAVKGAGRHGYFISSVWRRSQFSGEKSS